MKLAASFVFVLSPLLGAFPAPAQERPVQHLGELQPRVNAAIDLGVERLLELQNRDGSWGCELLEPVPHFDRRNGETALVVYTLRKCRVSADHPALQRALVFLEGSFPTHNYSISTQLLALDSVGDPARFKERIPELAQALVGNRIRNEGVWGYPNHAGVYVDLSNTQYATLGLRAAAHSGFKVPKEVWSGLVEGVLAFQETPKEIDTPAADGKSATGRREVAGFGYTPGEREAPTASMTAAGISILGLAREGLAKELTPPVARQIERAQRAGLAWLEREFSVEGNPRGPGAWHFYWLYGLERVGALLQLERIGEHDWYREGAAQLVREQKENGEWRTGGPVAWPAEPIPTSNTCFALLFLTKATAPSSGGESAVATSWAAEAPENPVWLRASGRARVSAWISGFAPGTVEAWGHGEDSAAALRIDKVEFLVDGALVRTIDVDVLVPWKGERFSFQHEFTSDGRHHLQARVHVAVPTAIASEGHTVEVLESAPLEIIARDVSQPWMLDYARAAAENRLELTTFSLRASSELANWTPASYACDGFQGTGWAFADGDREPTLTLELDKPQRTKLVLLGEIDSARAFAGRFARLRRVALYVNKDPTPLEFEFPADASPAEALLKHELPLPKPTVVRSLRLRILQWTPGREHSTGGIAEIELR